MRGEVRFDDGARALYATDSSNYRQIPIGLYLRLLDDDGLRSSMAAAGRETAVERFDADRAADVYVQAYEAALGHSALRRAT